MPHSDDRWQTGLTGRQTDAQDCATPLMAEYYFLFSRFACFVLVSRLDLLGGHACTVYTVEVLDTGCASPARTRVL